MSDAPPPSPARWPRRLAWGVGAVVMAGVAAGGAAWLFRVPLAERALATWCAERALSCRVKVTELTLSQVTLEGLTVATGTGTPLAADRISAQISWPGWVTPQVEALTLSGLTVRAAYDGERLTAHGLEMLAGDGGQAGGMVPAVRIEEGRFELATPAGPVSAAIDAMAAPDLEGRIGVRFDAADLATDDGRLVLQGGALEVALDGLSPRSGRLALDISEAAFDGLRLSAGQIEGTLAETGEGLQALSWSARLQRMEAAGMSFTGLRSAGRADLRRFDLADPAAALEAVLATTLTAQADRVETPSARAEAAALKLDARRGAVGGLLAGPMSLEAGPVTLVEAGSARGFRLSGEIAAGAGDVSLTGAVTANDAAITPSRAEALAGRLALPQPLDAHGAALVAAGREAAQAFDLALAFDATWREGGLAVTARRASVLEAASGLTLSISPFNAQPWLRLTPEALTLSGEIAVEGGGLPRLEAGLDRFALGLGEAGAIDISARDVRLADWSEAGLSLSTRAEALEWRQAGESLRFAFLGEVSMTGRMQGARLAETTLFGALEAARGVEGWRVQTTTRDCLGLRTDGIAFEGLSFGALSLPLCPDGGRLLQRRNGALAGALAFDELALPFRTEDTSGTLRLSDIAMTWTARDGIRLDVDAARLSLPLIVSGRTLLIDSEAPSLDIAIDGPALTIGGRLRSTAFGGALVPANVSAGLFDVTLSSGPGGLAGWATLADVTISDTRADPLYEPLAASLSANLANGQILMRGPVRLRRRGTAIADASLAVDLATLSGEAAMTSRLIAFQPGGLQPSDISDRLRGYFTDAAGEIEGVARLRFGGGAVSGEGAVSARDFGFQTLSVSRVEGVNGRVVFDDLLNLSTPPHQVVTIDRIDPGIALENGRVAFQLLGGREARLEEASWPFMGGRLAVDPVRWTIADPSRTLAVSATAIDLARLTEAFGSRDIEATGTVSGRFPIVFDGAAVRISDARLKADTAGGRLSYTGAVGERAGATSETVQMAFDALRDFRFSVLEIGMDGNVTGDILVSIKLEGRNPDVLDGAPFAFNVAIDSKLAQLLQSGQRMASSSWLADVVTEGVTGR